MAGFSTGKQMKLTNVKMSKRPERHLNALDIKRVRTDKENRNRVIIGTSIAVIAVAGIAIVIAKKKKSE